MNFPCGCAVINCQSNFGDYTKIDLTSTSLRHEPSTQTTATYYQDVPCLSEGKKEVSYLYDIAIHLTGGSLREPYPSTSLYSIGGPILPPENFVLHRQPFLQRQPYSPTENLINHDRQPCSPSTALFSIDSLDLHRKPYSPPENPVLYRQSLFP
ncbi:hypothetical protein J6590_037448 [Homalodisca vitripennis]|nr:hypothetical protein J6590_037448 [Homalodisca vitripennis]